MIEVQIKNEELYKRLKQYAIYSSDLTHVCSFRDELEPMLQESGIFDIFRDERNRKMSSSLPKLTIVNGNVMKLEGAPAEMLHFVGVRSEMDPTIPVSRMHEVHLLVAAGLVEPDERFKRLYSRLGYRDKIESLVCAKVRFRELGKLTDYIDPSATFQSMKFNDCREKPLVYRQMNVKIVKALEPKEKWDEIVCQTTDTAKPQRIILQFYNRPIILKSIAFLENRISIAFSKITETPYGSLRTIDPVILPKGLEFIKDVAVGPKSRQIPADLWRNAYYEFMFRYNFGGDE